MKNICFILLFALMSTAGHAQTEAQYASFNAMKRSISLSTGIVMKYVEDGAKDGVPVILLHGYTDSGRSFQLTMAELKKLNPQLRILTPDLRGHGGSSMPPGSCAGDPARCFTPELFANDIIAFMDHLKIPKAHIAAHSMGSMIAQKIALQHPSRVISMTLIGTAVNGTQSSFIHDFLIGHLIEGTWKPLLEKQQGFQWPADAYNLTPEDLGPAVVKFLADNWVTELGADKDYLKAIHQETIQVPIGTWLGAIASLGEMDHRKGLEDLKVPTLILWATQDAAVPGHPTQEEVRTTFQACARKSGTKVVYKTYGKVPLPSSGYQENDLGHNLQWSAPQAVAADISSFIKTGMPAKGLPYADPADPEEILIEETTNNVVVWGAPQ